MARITDSDNDFQSTDRSNVDELSDSDSEISVLPPKRPRGRACALSLIQRAICRVAVKKHAISYEILRVHFGCALSTIAKAVENGYAKPDAVDKDKSILKDPAANFHSTIRQLLHEKSLQEESSPGRTQGAATPPSYPWAGKRVPASREPPAPGVIQVCCGNRIYRQLCLATSRSRTEHLPQRQLLARLRGRPSAGRPLGCPLQQRGPH
ncbi:hypothetical protein C8R46DRAFT_1344574 [Mycena filopes]|nr:hypothetical protein C8R46DRAFT_1344574 [Mycena filopes]